MEDGILDKLLSVPAALWAFVCINAVALFKTYPFIMAKLNERHRDKAKEKDGDWSRLRAEIVRLDERCDHLQHEVDDCRAREADWMSRAIKAESALLGKGEVKQEAQRIVSADREEHAKRNKPSSDK